MRKFIAVLTIVGLQLLLLGGAVALVFLGKWVYGLRGCILALSIFDLCVIDTLVLTLAFSGALTAAGFAFSLFGAYGKIAES